MQSFFHFWDISWYSDECAKRLHYIPVMNSLHFVYFYLKQKQMSSAWSFTENAFFISFHGGIWSRYLEVSTFKISRLIFLKQVKNALKKSGFKDSFRYQETVCFTRYSLQKLADKSCAPNDFQDSLQYIFNETSSFSKFSVKTSYEKS